MENIDKKSNEIALEIDKYDLLNPEISDFVKSFLRIYSHGKSDLMDACIKNNIYPIFKEEIEKNKSGKTYHFFNDTNAGWSGNNIVENIEYSLNWKQDEEPLMRKIIQYYDSNKDKYAGQIAASAVIIAAAKDKNNIFSDTLIINGIDSDKINQVFNTQEDYYGTFNYSEEWKKIRKYILPDDEDPQTLTSNDILKSVLSKSDGKLIMSGLLNVLSKENKKIDKLNSIEKEEIDKANGIEKEENDSITVAADWWADAIKKPKQDAGEPILNFLFMQTSSMTKKELSDEKIEKFKGILKEGINEHMKEYGRCTLDVDYHPCEILEKAGSAIGLRDMIDYPIKTTMRVTKDKVEVAYGYGKSFETIWSSTQNLENQEDSGPKM